MTQTAITPELLAGPDIDEAIALLEAVREEMEARYRGLLDRGARKIVHGDGRALHVVVCDELAFYLTVEDKKQRMRFAEVLRDLVPPWARRRRDRDRGDAEAGGRRRPERAADLFGFRLAMRCTTRDASDMILGQGLASLGYSAATIAPDERCIGLLVAEDGMPRRIRAYYLDDQAVDGLAGRAAELREAAS